MACDGIERPVVKREEARERGGSEKRASGEERKRRQRRRREVEKGTRGTLEGARGERKGKREWERRRNKSGKNESIGGVFHDAPLEALQVGERNRRSQADLGPPFCDNGREGVCLSDWLIYGLLSSWTSFYRLFGCTHRRVLQPPGNPATPPPHTTASLYPTVDDVAPYPLLHRCCCCIIAARIHSRMYVMRTSARIAEESSRKIANVSYTTRARARALMLLSAIAKRWLRYFASA